MNDIPDKVKFVGYLLIEEYINSDIGSNSKEMYELFEIFLKEKYNNICNKIKFYDKMSERPNNIYNIYPIIAEKHATILILQKVNDNKTIVNFVNSGYGLENNNNEIYLTFEIDKPINIVHSDLLCEGHYTINLNTSCLLNIPYFQIYRRLKEYIKKEKCDNMSENLLKILKPSEQISGSCTFYSILYSINYIYYSFESSALNLKNEMRDWMIENLNNIAITEGSYSINIEIQKIPEFGISNYGCRLFLELCNIIDIKYNRHILNDEHKKLLYSKSVNYTDKIKDFITRDGKLFHISEPNLDHISIYKNIEEIEIIDFLISFEKRERENI
jgi:hypothetical protein